MTSPNCAARARRARLLADLSRYVAASEPTLPTGETVLPFLVSDDRWGFDEYDVANQGLTSHHFKIVEGGRVHRLSVPFRYVWPSELDLMAEMAGMRLRERWAGWKREPFTSESRQHVSVWERPADSARVG